MHKLPVDQVIPELIQALVHNSSVVLHAPPGSGKTSRVPLALLHSVFSENGTILMLEPRRLAAVNASCWLARSINQSVGETVGYSIRFDRKVSAKTKIEVLTEGLLTRRFQSDPALDGVSVVIFDEFHERTLHADTALAFCLEIQKIIRPDLKILIMSATLHTEPLLKILGDAPLISCTGITYPVELRYSGPPSGDIVSSTAGAVRRALVETTGDILVFLPGAAEIRSCYNLLLEFCSGDIQLFQLYGDLTFAQQEKALAPSDKRKIVIATNIAETSLTIDGVRVVIDSGLARIVRFDNSKGMNRMQTIRIPRASATQRAGRAGRQAPGICYRLWDKNSEQNMLPFNLPEIKSVDLAPLALELAKWGDPEKTRLSWIDPPSIVSMVEARSVLKQLGAIDHPGKVTDTGRRMSELPLHPRLAAIVMEGESMGVPSLACDLAAIISEREIYRREYLQNRHSVRCDFTDRLETLDEWRSGSALSSVVDVAACIQVDRVASRLKKAFPAISDSQQNSLSMVPLILLKGFPERVAVQRCKGSDRYLLASGTGGRLGKSTTVHDEQFIVAVEISADRGSEGIIHSASAVTAEQIRRQFRGDVILERNCLWDSTADKVLTTVSERFGAVELSLSNASPSDDEASKALLSAIQNSPSIGMLPWSASSRQFQARVGFLNAVIQERQLPDISDKALSENLSDWLAPAIKGMRSLSELKRLDLTGLLRSLFTWEQIRMLDDAAPADVQVPSGSRVRIDYSNQVPFIAVKLQEMFGLADTPRIVWGRVPLLIHLLSPAQRPIQVTDDLRSFWESTYPQVKKELKGRYPKHPWPDDPWSALPTRKTVKNFKPVK